MHKPISPIQQLRAPQLLLGAYFFALPWVSFLSSHALGGAMLIPALIIILYALIKHKASWRSAFAKDNLIIIGPLLTLVWLSCLFSSQPTKAAHYALSASAAILVISALVLALRQIGEFKLYFSKLTQGLIFGTALLVIQQLFSFSLIDRLHNNDPAYWNVYLNRGTVILVLFTLALFPHLVGHANKRHVAGAFLLITLLCFLGESGAASVGLLAGFAMWLASLALGPYRLGQMFFFGVAALLVCLPFAYSYLLVLLDTIAPLWGIETSFARLELWSIISQQIVASPLVGAGIEASRFLSYDLSTTKYLTAHSGIYHPHNAILQIWIEFGLPGVLLGLFYLRTIWVLFARLDPAEQKALLTTLAGGLVIILTGYNIWQPWLLAGLAQSIFIALYAQSKPEKIN